MKKKNSIYILLFLNSLFFISCDLENKKPNPIDNKSLKEHIIPVNKAIVMHREYNNLRADLLKDTLKEVYGNPKFTDSKFAWFSLKDMKAYLNYIEAIQEANPEQDVSGIRIYFAAYPNEKRTEDKHNKYPGQQTFFMVPTVNVKDLNMGFNTLNHLPFYISTEEKNNSVKGKFVVINDLLYPFDKSKRLNTFYKNNNQQSNKNQKNANNNKQKMASSASATASTTTSSAVAVSTVFNEGEACPPPFPND